MKLIKLDKIEEEIPQSKKLVTLNAREISPENLNFKIGGSGSPAYVSSFSSYSGLAGWLLLQR